MSGYERVSIYTMRVSRYVADIGREMDATYSAIGNEISHEPASTGIEERSGGS